jgi:lysophospholipase L1-like esterase
VFGRYVAIGDNLAVRGKRVHEVLDDQLPHALAMRPDLITVCVGMNDVTMGLAAASRTVLGRWTTAQTPPIAERHL